MMLRRIWFTTSRNFRKWFGTPRILVLGLLAVILCTIAADPLRQFSYRVNESINIFEPFICAFNDRFLAFFAYGIMLLLLCDAPFLDSGQAYVIFRTGRKTWMIGTQLYIVLSCFVVLLFLLIIMAAIVLQRAFLANEWSNVGTLLAVSNASMLENIVLLPRTVYFSMLPYQALIQTFLLVWLYWIFLSEILLLFNMLYGQAAGMVITAGIHIEGWAILFTMQPSLYALSPMLHSVLSMHSFGYDRLPTVGQSALLYLGLIALLVTLVLFVIRKYTFKFGMQGEETR